MHVTRMPPEEGQEQSEMVEIICFGNRSPKVKFVEESGAWRCREIIKTVSGETLEANYSRRLKAREITQGGIYPLQTVEEFCTQMGMELIVDNDWRSRIC